MKHLLLRGSSWYARLGIPADVRAKLGHKREFIQTLKTADKRKALILSGPLLSEWRNAIELARGSASAIESTALQLREYALQDTETDPVTGMSGSEFAAESIAESLEGHEQEQFYTLYTGRTGTPLDYFAEEFISNNYSNPKTAGDARRAIARLKIHCPTLQKLNRHAVRKWLQSETRSRSSVTKTLSFLSVYWSFLQNKEVVDIESNPFNKPQIPKALKPKEKREPYTNDEVRLILAALSESKDNQLESLVLLAMYTGARISELAALTTEDVLLQDSITCLIIRDSKTEAGKRTVPVHKLIKNLVSKLENNTADGFLVSGVNSKGGSDRRADVLGKRFGRLVRNKIKLPKSKVFHCFRNTAISKLEQAGVPENTAADIVGHEKDTVTYGLYSSGTTIRQRLTALNKIDYSA
jgi:integrase